MSVRLSSLSIAALCFVACNSGAGGDVVLRIEAEMAGARCTSGGVAVQTGFDKNSNQVLDDDEVSAEQTKYVCNGAPGTGGMTGPAGETGDAGTPGTPGLNALSVVTAEAAGANCTYGGVRIDVGLDANADGTLGTTEITSTRYVCDRASVDSVYFGDLTIRTAEDLAQLDGIKVVAGTLTIESLPGGVLTLPTLEIVSNQLVFASRDGGQGLGDAVTSASFPALLRAGDFNARFNPALTSLSVPNLEWTNRLDLSYLDGLTTFTAARLAYAGDLYITNNSVLTALNFPVLRRAHSFQVSSHALLTGLTAPLLTDVAGYLGITDNTTLSTCAAYRLAKNVHPTNSNYSVFNNDQTPVCTASDHCALQTVVGITNPLAWCLRPLDFAASQALCATMSTGAGLAWVTSDSEWAALSAAVVSGDVQGGWLGYTDAAAEGAWVSTSGFTGYSPTQRTDFWDPGYPSADATQNAMFLAYTGKAQDRGATEINNAICRVP